MSVTNIDSWRLPGCGDFCWPNHHAPSSHEDYGRLLERDARQERVVKTGQMVIDLKRRTVTVSGADIPISPREWELLAYYAERPNLWCLASEIVLALWGGIDPGSALSTARWRLRQRLGAAGVLLETRGLKNGVQWSRLRVEEVA